MAVVLYNRRKSTRTSRACRLFLPFAILWKTSPDQGDHRAAASTLARRLAYLERASRAFSILADGPPLEVGTSEPGIELDVKLELCSSIIR
jgi:hypothetical protein